MINEKNTHDVTSADLRLHQKRGRQALMLENRRRLYSGCPGVAEHRK